MEIWRDVKGFEGRYKVSNLGRIKSVERTVERIDGNYNIVPEKIMKLSVDKEGYEQLCLTMDSKKYTLKVHKCVAEAFIENPNEYECVNHIDENKRNNRVENLEWCEQHYNVRYSCNIPVMGTSTYNREYKFYPSITDTVNDGFILSNVAKVCKGAYGRKTCKGWSFEYLTGRFIIGIDESYNRCGITLLYEKKIVEMISENYEECKNNTDKRKKIRKTLKDLISKWRLDKRNTVVITERIRLRSQGFLSENYIKSTGALLASIIDVCYRYKLPVYSVDTRSWKSQVVGSSKPLNNPYGINPEKYRTILYMRDKGLLKRIAEEYEGRGEKGVIEANRKLLNGRHETVRIKINDDLADSYCIALYGFLPKSKQKLKEERF